MNKFFLKAQNLFSSVLVLILGLDILFNQIKFESSVRDKDALLYLISIPSIIVAATLIVVIFIKSPPVVLKLVSIGVIVFLIFLLNIVSARFSDFGLEDWLTWITYLLLYLNLIFSLLNVGKKIKIAKN